MVILRALANKAALVVEMEMIAAAAKVLFVALTVVTPLNMYPETKISSVIVKPAVAVKITLAPVETVSAQMLMRISPIMDKATTRIEAPATALI